MADINEAVQRLKDIRKEPKETEAEKEPEELAESEDAAGTEVPETPESVEAEEETESSDAESIELDAEQLTTVFGLEEGNLSVDEAGKLRFKTKVDGEEGSATLEDLIERYQKDASLTKRGQEIAAIKQSREKALQDFMQTTNQHAQQFAEILEALKGVFTQPLDQKMMAELKDEDPGRYAQMKTDQSERERAFEMLTQAALKSVQDAQKAQSDEYQRQLKEYLDEQGKVSRGKIPNYEKAFPEIQEYLKANEFSEEDLGNIADSRLWVLAHKAMLHDRGLEGVKKKLVKKVPKLVHAGKSIKQSQTDLEKARKHLKESGSLKAAQEYFKARNRS